MSDSPYTPPQATINLSSDPARESVRRVAKYQRYVIFALLANILANIIAFTTLGGDATVRVAVMVLSLGAMAFAMVAIFLLAKELLNTGLAILCAVLMVAPCISLIVLLLVNQKATSYLQSNGVRVGFLGTSPDSF